VNTADGRGTWWVIAFIVGAALGWLIASSGGVFFGLVFLFPFGVGGGRLRAAIAGLLTGASLTALAVRGPAMDIATFAAGATLLVGLFATARAFRRP
jgi:hypothetical protein